VLHVPSVNVDQFLNRAEAVLSVLHNPEIEFIGGGINVTYLIETNRKQNLDSLSYSLSSTVNFPIGVQNNVSLAIGSIVTG
jgi:hypothetical protein